MLKIAKINAWCKHFFQKVIPFKTKLTSSKHSKPPLQQIFTLDVLLDTSPSPSILWKKTWFCSFFAAIHPPVVNLGFVAPPNEGWSSGCHQTGDPLWGGGTMCIKFWKEQNLGWIKLHLQIYCWWKKSCSRLFGIFSISISRLLSSKVAFLAAKSSLKSFTWIFHNQNLHSESCDSRVSNRHYILWRNGNMCVTCFFWSSLPAKHSNTSWSDVSVTVASIWPNAHVLHSEMITVAYVASKHAT